MVVLNSSLTDQLKEKFPDLIILTPASPEYEGNMLRWNVAAEKKAVGVQFNSLLWASESHTFQAAVIYPLSSQDVSGILSYAQANSIELAVCGAGHNHRGNSVDDGLVIDLRKMTTVSVDPSSKRVTAQGATVWGSIYEAAEKHGLAMVGGLIPSVGVGGFTLNGGLGVGDILGPQIPPFKCFTKMIFLSRHVLRGKYSCDMFQPPNILLYKAMLTRRLSSVSVGGESLFQTVS
jgi:hypothetical protein